MKHLGLFEGIGGFSLAAKWMGWETVAWCEWNEFCQKVLRFHFPEAEGFGDITKTDFTKYANRIDILTGGFPCQPYSQAGKRKGKADDRHLWPQMLRAIREVQPCWVVGENVPGLLNWERGMVLDEIKADLEAAGFEVFPPLVLPACGKNAPHRRDRLFIIANSSGKPEQQKIKFRKQINREGRQEMGYIVTATYESGIITNSQCKRLPEWDDKQNGRHTQSKSERFNGFAGWKDFPTVSPIRGRDDGLSSKLVKQCLEGLGNAIVPQVAYEIFKAIKEVEYDTL